MEPTNNTCSRCQRPAEDAYTFMSMRFCRTHGLAIAINRVTLRLRSAA